MEVDLKFMKIIKFMLTLQSSKSLIVYLLIVEVKLDNYAVLKIA